MCVRSLPHPSHATAPRTAPPTHSYCGYVFCIFIPTEQNLPTEFPGEPHRVTVRAGLRCTNKPATLAFLLLHPFARGWARGTAQDQILIRKRPQKLTLYERQSFENSAQVLSRGWWSGEDWDHRGLAAERWVRTSISGLLQPAAVQALIERTMGVTQVQPTVTSTFSSRKEREQPRGSLRRTRNSCWMGTEFRELSSCPSALTQPEYRHWASAISEGNRWGSWVMLRGGERTKADGETREKEMGEYERPAVLGAHLQGGISEEAVQDCSQMAWIHPPPAGRWLTA